MRLSGSIQSQRLAAVALKVAIALLFVASLAAPRVALAEDEPPMTPDQQRAMNLLNSIEWQVGPCTVDIGSNAKMDIPAGYRYTGPAGASTWAEITQNMPGDIGVLMPAESFDWFLTFNFDDVGYVDDKEKDELDADALLSSMKEATEAGNEFRRGKGWSALHIDGWVHKPAYDPSSNNLVWSLTAHDDQGDISTNYSTRILGRRGVMSVTLVVQADQLDAVVPQTKTLLKSFSFKSGETHSEWVSGDKVAGYGLAGLITAGAAVGAAKMGLFAKLFAVLAKGGKAIILVVVAGAAGVWKLITGRRSEA